MLEIAVAIIASYDKEKPRSIPSSSKNRKTKQFEMQGIQFIDLFTVELGVSMFSEYMINAGIKLFSSDPDTPFFNVEKILESAELSVKLQANDQLD